MKQAKPSKGDLEKAFKVTIFLSCITSGFLPEDAAGNHLEFDKHDPEHCHKAIQVLLELNAESQLHRTVYAAETLLNPENKIVDPDLPYLEVHPERKLDSEKQGQI